MDALDQMVEDLTKDELRHLKYYFSRSDWYESRLDVALIDLMRKYGKKHTDDEMWRILYPEGTKNNYYRLRNRLIDEITRAMTLQYFDRDESNFIMYLTAMSKIYFSRNKFKLSEFFLKKAEGKATKINAHELLDIIYTDYIKLSHELLNIN